MYVNERLNEFGLYLKQLRINSGYTQQDVEDQVGINTDTLRRIENGKVIVKYSTLVQLSLAYKKDLFVALAYYKNDSKIYNIYSKVDTAIINYNPETVIELKNDIDALIKSSEFLNSSNMLVLEQIRYLIYGLEGMLLFKDYDQSLKNLMSALKITLPDVDIYNFKNIPLSTFELRILLMIAVSLSELNQLVPSNTILHVLLNTIDIDVSCNPELIYLKIKIISNLAYNFFDLKQYNDALTISEVGIDFCVSHNTMYGLSTLLYRKGISLFKLDKENDTYLKFLKQSISLLVIQQKSDLAELYKKITYEKYNINLDL